MQVQLSKWNYPPLLTAIDWLAPALREGLGEQKAMKEKQVIPVSLALP